MTLRRLVLEFDSDAVPITGSVLGPGGVRREFCGWLALIAGLELEFNGSETEPQPPPGADGG